MFDAIIIEGIEPSMVLFINRLLHLQKYELIADK
jgi:hypothetical protein